MRRKLFNFAAAVSLLCCVLAGGMWVRSQYRLDIVYSESIGVGTFTSGKSEAGCYFQFIPKFGVDGFPHNWTWLSSSAKISAVDFSQSWKPATGDGPEWGGRFFETNITAVRLSCTDFFITT